MAKAGVGVTLWELAMRGVMELEKTPGIVKRKGNRGRVVVETKVR